MWIYVTLTKVICGPWHDLIEENMCAKYCRSTSYFENWLFTSSPDTDEYICRKVKREPIITSWKEIWRPSVPRFPVFWFSRRRFFKEFYHICQGAHLVLKTGTIWIVFHFPVPPHPYIVLGDIYRRFTIGEHGCKECLGIGELGQRYLHLCNSRWYNHLCQHWSNLLK